MAHQWWGNLVVPASYHDNWLIESLANYSALLLLERNKGVKALDTVLDDYRTHLLTKTEMGHTLESAGPIVWGYRLESSLAPDAWRAVTYEKGTWIIHMLRRRLGDEKFHGAAQRLASHHHSISTEEFRDLASQYAPQSPDPGPKDFLRQLGVWNRRARRHAVLFLARREAFRDPAASAMSTMPSAHMFRWKWRPAARATSIGSLPAAIPSRFRFP